MSNTRYYNIDPKRISNFLRICIGFQTEILYKQRESAIAYVLY